MKAKRKPTVAASKAAPAAKVDLSSADTVPTKMQRRFAKKEKAAATAGKKASERQKSKLVVSDGDGRKEDAWQEGLLAGSWWRWHCSPCWPLTATYATSKLPEKAEPGYSGA
jgi:hypothetical protein